MGLLSLPADLLLEIQSLLKPSDVLALQSTCTYFRDAEVRRKAWQDALRRVIQENDVFPTTFAVKTMSTAELAHAALAPSRFCHLIKQNGTMKSSHSDIPFMNPVAKYTVTHQLFCHGKHKTKLLPGGRFLLAWDQHILQVYDLGYISNSTFQEDREPVFALHAHMLTGLHDAWQPWEYDIPHTFVQDDLVLFFTFLPRYWDNSEISAIIVYRISNIGARPSGKEMQRFLIAPSLIPQSIMRDMSYCLCASTSRLAFKCGDGVIRVWDYERNLMASLRSQFEITLADICALKRETIICRDPSCQLVAYDLPSFLPVPIAGPAEGPKSSAILQSWYKGSCFSLTRANGVTVLDFYDPRGETGRFYVDDESVVNQSGESPPSVRLTRVASIRPPLDPERWTDYPGPRLCDDNIATAVCQFPRRHPSTDAIDLVSLVVHLRHLSDDDGLHDRYLQLLEYIDSSRRGTEAGAFDMCPVAGRVCEMHGRLLHVYDYLPPPNDFSPPLDA